METIILGAVLVGLAVVAVWYYNKDTKNLDVNQDGQIDAKDAVTAVQRTADGVTKDAREARDVALAVVSESAARATVVAEKAAQKAKSVAKKATTRKPRAKK